VENRIKRVEKIAKVGGDKAAKIEYELLLRYKDALEQGQSARTVIPQNDDEEQCAKQMFLLTTKPVLYVCNVDDVSAAKPLRARMRNSSSSPPRPKPTSPNWRHTKKSRCSSKTWD
jgi:ribosome-binding ATPase YchF (GTP1/OBG family)